MKEYKRLTKKGGWHDNIDLKEELGYKWIYQRLAELEDKIENGEVIIPKFSIGKEIYYIDYYNYERTCEHCGETYYEEELKGVSLGKIAGFIIRKGKVLFSIDYKIDTGSDWYTNRGEQDIFLTKAEAEKKLKEIQDARRKT